MSSIISREKNNFEKNSQPFYILNFLTQAPGRGNTTIPDLGYLHRYIDDFRSNDDMLTWRKIFFWNSLSASVSSQKSLETKKKKDLW